LVRAGCEAHKGQRDALVKSDLGPQDHQAEPRAIEAVVDRRAAL
jgi:hypothetical protein